jgi:hypothetical protein
MIKKLTIGFALILVLVGVAYPAFAETSTSTDVGICMQKAVEKRDTAIISAYDTYSAGLKTALTARMADLKSAWGMADKSARKTAIKDAWAKFKTTRAGLRQTLGSSRDASWITFRNDRVACKAPADGNGSSVDI